MFGCLKLKQKLSSNEPEYVWIETQMCQISSCGNTVAEHCSWTALLVKLHEQGWPVNWQVLRIWDTDTGF